MAEEERGSEMRVRMSFDIEDNVEKQSVTRDRSGSLPGRNATLRTHRVLIEIVLICFLGTFLVIFLWWRPGGRGSSVVSNGRVDLVELGKRLHPAADAGWLSQKIAVALFFCGHQDSTCRTVTPMLSRVFVHSLREKGVEVVFVSLDIDEESFNSYFALMPWKALSFNEWGPKSELMAAFRITKCPSIALLNTTGFHMSLDGARDLVTPSWGIKTYPLLYELFKPLMDPRLGSTSVMEYLKGFNVIDHDGKQVAWDDLKHGILGLYFTAHWCPSCVRFTPNLADWYDKDLKEKGLEVLFVSFDYHRVSRTSAAQYFDMQPWLALNFTRPGFSHAVEGLFRALDRRTIPTLVLVDPVKDQVITKKGREILTEDPTGLKFPWPRIVQNLAKEDGLGYLEELEEDNEIEEKNDIPVVIALCEEADVSEQRSAQQALVNANQKCLEEAHESGRALDEADFRFMIVTQIDEKSMSVRTRMSLPVRLPEGQVEHKLGQPSCKLVLFDRLNDEFYESATNDLSITRALESLMAGFLNGSLPPKQLK